jgi:hypothetical protein
VSLGLAADADGTTVVTGLVFGGTGKYAFNWAMYSLGDPWNPGLRELGLGDRGQVRSVEGAAIEISTVRVPAGANTVLLNVKDRITGAFKHHQQSVYSIGSVTHDLIPGR